MAGFQVSINGRFWVSTGAPAGAFAEMVTRLGPDRCRVAVSTDGDEIAEGVTHHARLAGAEIAWISGRSDTVSREFQVAIQTADGIRISHVIETADAVPEFD